MSCHKTLEIPKSSSVNISTNHQPQSQQFLVLGFIQCHVFLAKIVAQSFKCQSVFRMVKILYRKDKMIIAESPLKKGSQFAQFYFTGHADYFFMGFKLMVAGGVSGNAVTVRPVAGSKTTRIVTPSRVSHATHLAGSPTFVVKPPVPVCAYH